MDLPLWQLLCIHQSGKTLIIPQQSMPSKRQSLCCVPMPPSAIPPVLQALLHLKTHPAFQLESPASHGAQPLEEGDNCRPLLNLLTPSRSSAPPSPHPKVTQGDTPSQVCTRLCMSLVALQDELSTSDSEDVKTNPPANVIQSSVIHVLLRAIISFLLLPASPLTISL